MSKKHPYHDRQPTPDRISVIPVCLFTYKTSGHTNPKVRTPLLRRALHQQIYNQSGRKSKHHNKYQINNKVPHPQYHLQCPKIRDLGRRPCNHKRCRASHAHPIYEPCLKEWYGSAAASIERNADSSRHKHPKDLISSKESRHNIFRNIPLKQCGKQNTKQEIRERLPEYSFPCFSADAKTGSYPCHDYEAHRNAQTERTAFLCL